MTTLLYILAGSAYLAANYFVLRIAIAEWKAGNRWIINTRLLENPAQLKRFICFGVLMVIAVSIVVIGRLRI